MTKAIVDLLFDVGKRLLGVESIDHRIDFCRGEIRANDRWQRYDLLYDETTLPKRRDLPPVLLFASHGMTSRPSHAMKLNVVV